MLRACRVPVRVIRLPLVSIRSCGPAHCCKVRSLVVAIAVGPFARVCIVSTIWSSPSVLFILASVCLRLPLYWAYPFGPPGSLLALFSPSCPLLSSCGWPLAYSWRVGLYLVLPPGVRVQSTSISRAGVPTSRCRLLVHDSRSLALPSAAYVN